MPVAPPVVVEVPQIEVPVVAAASQAPLSASLWEDIGSSREPQRDPPAQPPARTALAILLGFLLASAILGLGGLIFWIVRGGAKKPRPLRPTRTCRRKRRISRHRLATGKSSTVR